MTLLQEIQQAALDSSVPLTDLLRKCKVLAARLKHEEFASWINHELNGYDDRAALPGYRRLSVQSLGHFSGPFGSGIRNAPIPALRIPEEFRHIATEQVFLEPVGSLAALSAGSSTLQGKWPADVIAYLQHHAHFYENMVLADAWRVVPGTAVQGILDTVRTRVLDFALAIEEQEPAAGEVQPGQPPPVAPETVTNIYHTTIHGGQANIGTSGDASIAVGASSFSAVIPEESRASLPRLFAELRDELGELDAGDREEATSALANVEKQLQAPEPRVDRVKRYLDIYATIVNVASPTYQALLHIVNSLA